MKPKAGLAGIRLLNAQANTAPSMKNSPCATLTIRITPKTSDRPRAVNATTKAATVPSSKARKRCGPKVTCSSRLSDRRPAKETPPHRQSRREAAIDSVAPDSCGRHRGRLFTQHNRVSILDDAAENKQDDRDQEHAHTDQQVAECAIACEVRVGDAENQEQDIGCYQDPGNRHPRIAGAN